MTNERLLIRADLDCDVSLPGELRRIVDQGLVDLSPWHVLSREDALKRIRGLRQRYKTKYVPIARRQDNDDLAVLDPARPGTIVVIHDFATEGSERRKEYDSFWTWFRGAIEDMINFE